MRALSSRPLFAVVVAGACACATLDGCLGATQIVVDVYSEVPCDVNAEVAFTDGALDQLDSLPPSSTKTGCEPGTNGSNHVGTIVLQPRDAKDASVAFEVVTREDAAPTEKCAPGGDVSACIVAKRRVSFIPHETQRIVVDLRLACAGVRCPSDQTCVRGACVPSQSPQCNDAPCDESSLTGTTETPLPPAADKDHVLVVYNRGWTDDADGDGVTDSEEVARYYASKRGIDASRVIGVTTTMSPAAKFADYSTNIAQPVADAIDALGAGTIHVVVLSYGLPVGFDEASDGAIDNYLMAPRAFAAVGTTPTVNPYYDAQPGFGPEVGHLDATKHTFGGHPIVLVTRLDGPLGVSGALDLVDQALYAERYLGSAKGDYGGNAYVDALYGSSTTTAATDPDVTSGNYANRTAIDKNLAYAGALAATQGFAVDLENTAASIGDAGSLFVDGSAATAAPRALLYAGWDHYHQYNDAFEWLPGSVADDFDAASLATASVHTNDPYWGWSAIARGATCVAGVISEPGTELNPRPAALFHYLFRGYDYAEASGAATPSLGWMATNVGDALYAPFRSDKPHVVDNRPPRAKGAPRVTTDAAGTTISALVDDTFDPEVARITVEWGPTSAYGSSVTGSGFYRRPAVSLGKLVSGATLHYAVTLVDPVGNATRLGDATFTP